MQSVKVSIQGMGPMMMHNARLANSLDSHTKQLKEMTDKRKKTESDVQEISRLEWEGGLYYDEEIGPYIPSRMIIATIVNGAKKQKMGQAFKSAIFVQEEQVPLIYDGPRKLRDLWKQHERFVDVRTAGLRGQKVLRTRPIFNGWSLDFSVDFDDDQINRSQLVKAVEDAGVYVGIGDYRPFYGKFNLTGVA